MYYVFVPKKTRPKSQHRPDLFYGGFSTVEAANAWKKEKGLNIYPTVLVLHESDVKLSYNSKIIEVKENK